MASSKAKTEAVKAEVKEEKIVAAAKTEEKPAAKAAAKKATAKVETKKEEPKKEEAKKEEVKKAEPKKAAAKKPAAKKPAAKKTTAKKTTAKKSVKKPASRMILQFMGKDVNVADLQERALAQFAAVQPDVAVKEIAMYLKPEDSAAYYVINDEHMGKVEY